MLVTDVAGLDASEAASDAADDACAVAFGTACQTLVIEPLFNGTEAPSSEDVDRGIAIAARLVENASSHNHSAVLLASKLKGVEGYWRGLCGASIKMQRPPPEATPDRLRAIGALTKLGGGQQTDSFMEVAEVVARVLGAERAASLERGFAPHELVRDFVKARDAWPCASFARWCSPGGSSRNLCLATLRGDGGGEAEPGGPTWLAALDAADDEFLRELVVHGPPPHCTPSEEAEAAFYEGLGEATRPVVGLRAAHPALRLRAARDAAALKLDVGDALVESGALLAALEADAAWARASCVARVARRRRPAAGVRPRAAVPRGLPRGGAVRFWKAPAALSAGGFDLCRLALEDASLDPTLRKEAVAALGGYLGEEVAPEPEEFGGELEQPHRACRGGGRAGAGRDVGRRSVKTVTAGDAARSETDFSELDAVAALRAATLAAWRTTTHARPASCLRTDAPG